MLKAIQVNKEREKGTVGVKFSLKEEKKAFFLHVLFEQTHNIG
jgi:hypothetical protein